MKTRANTVMYPGYVFARMEDPEILVIHRICNIRGETLSSFVRRAVKRELARMGYLSKAQAKALGMTEGRHHDDG